MSRSEKLLVGPRVRRFRQSLGLTQARMAEDLDISASYLNLIERNQRALSAKVLLRMAQVYDFDVASFTGESDAHLVAELYEAFRDPLFGGDSVSKAEAEDLVGLSPAAARKTLKLYTAHRDLRRRSTEADRDTVELLEQSSESVNAVREVIQRERNYFPKLDAAAEQLSDELNLAKREPHAALTERLRDRHDLSVRILPVDVMPDMLRWFDRHSRRINLSELLRQSGRRFQLAYQIGLLEHRELIDRIITDNDLPGREAERLMRTSLANYFAAATLMPYARFLKEAEATRYDVDLLGHRFGTSWEQTAHRLTTLNKPDARGIPFFFLRIDVAGNVSKRFSAGRFPFSQFGGACPLWNIHETFQTPGRTLPQLVELPDGKQFLTVSRMVTRSDATWNRPAQKLAIGLGCDATYAPRLVYSRQLDPARAEPTPIGTTCYLCERPNCHQRAHAPLNRSITFDERGRFMSLFPFMIEE